MASVERLPSASVAVSRDAVPDNAVPGGIGRRLFDGRPYIAMLAVGAVVTRLQVFYWSF
jgi:hypothetical protein